jgi:nucleoside-diphosphate-sugar epimerase
VSEKGRVLVTGSSGFIGGYLVQELLDHGYTVVGVDNHSKYGPVARSYDAHPHYEFQAGDCRDAALLKDLAGDCDHLVAGAARIGGISYFHQYAYDLLADNERIIAATFDAAIWAHRERRLQKITVMSSSMVFENATVFPTPEGHEKACPPPPSSYGFQKLACEYFARAAWDQYQLPYTIVRPFNCVGTGERRALGGSAVKSGNVELALSHVVPDLIQKVLKGQDPLRLLGDGTQVRHYTYGGDIARGVRLAMESARARNEDFNVSNDRSTSVLELAEIVWKKIHGNGKPFRWESDAPFQHDVQRRIPDTRKARDVLGFAPTTSLDAMLDEVIAWIGEEIRQGTF